MTTDRPARRRPALASRIAVTGISTAATLGMVGGWGLAGTRTAGSHPDPVVEQREAPPPTIVVRVVRRHAATPVRRIVQRVVRAPAPASRHAAPNGQRAASTRTKAS